MRSAAAREFEKLGAYVRGQPRRWDGTHNWGETGVNSKNIDKLVEEAWEIERTSAQEAGALGFMARALTIATMPHRKTTDLYHERRNGAFSLVMMSPPRVGLPYGSMPRLLVAWLTTEVRRTRERTLVLGPSLGGFMRDLGITPSAGRWGTKTTLRDQMRRLFACSVHGFWADDTRDAGRNYIIADAYDLWWDPQREDQAALWQSTVTLGERFHREILDHPVPVDLRVLRALKRSPLAIDIYAWLTHRVSYMRKDMRISWPGLQGQFGSGYSKNAQGQRDFRRAFRYELKKVMLLYQEASVEDSSECLLVKPSRPHILPAPANR